MHSAFSVLASDPDLNYAFDVRSINNVEATRAEVIEFMQAWQQLSPFDDVVPALERLGVPMWVCQAARLAFKQAVFVDGPTPDITSFVTQVERVARFEIPKTR